VDEILHTRLWSIFFDILNRLHILARGTVHNSIGLCTLVMIPYIENSNISFSILIYHIISYHQKNVEFFDISQCILDITIFLIYRDILCQKFIFLLLHYQNNENKWKNDKLTKAN